jgi:hypothetical protein
MAKWRLIFYSGLIVCALDFQPTLCALVFNAAGFYYSSVKELSAAGQWRQIILKVLTGARGVIKCQPAFLNYHTTRGSKRETRSQSGLSSVRVEWRQSSARISTQENKKLTS